MTDDKYQERITIGDSMVILERPVNPVEVTTASGAELFRMLNVFDSRLVPENYDKADGAPMRLFNGDSVRVDLSKRSVEDMGFWHRSVDFNEIIFCVKGALRWETELGTVTLHEGEMIWIPRGIAHRSMLCEDSLEENVLMELKIAEDLECVIENDQ